MVPPRPCLAPPFSWLGGPKICRREGLRYSCPTCSAHELANNSNSADNKSESVFKIRQFGLCCRLQTFQVSTRMNVAGQHCKSETDYIDYNVQLQNYVSHCNLEMMIHSINAKPKQPSQNPVFKRFFHCMPCWNPSSSVRSQGPASSKTLGKPMRAS